MSTAETVRHVDPAPAVVKDDDWDHWATAVRSLVDDVEQWCAERDWSTRRGETVLAGLPGRPPPGPALPRLLFHTGDRRYLVQPTWKHPGSADGEADLEVLPEGDRCSLAYHRGVWLARLNSIEEGEAGRRQPAAAARWNEAVFVDLLARLATVADSVEF